MFLLHGIAIAQSDKLPQFSNKAQNSINHAASLLNPPFDADPQAALIYIDRTLKNFDLRPHEKAVLLQIKGQAHYELEQFTLAIQAFEDAINTGGLTEKNVSQSRLHIAQLLIIEGEYERGAEMLESLIDNVDYNKKNKYLNTLTQAWVQAENYQRALPWAEQWFALAESKDRRHFDLMNFLYNNLGETDKQTRIVETMYETWPEDTTLWKTLDSIYQYNGRDRDAFNLMKTHYSRGDVKRENDIKRLVQYYAAYDMPLKAADILNKEITKGTISETPKITVWLSTLYESASQEKVAEILFLKAIKGSDEKTAKIMRDNIQKHGFKQKIDLYPFTPISELTQAKRIDRRHFKIVVSDRSATPLVRTPPNPPIGLSKSGYCDVRFDVTDKGIPVKVKTTYCTQDILSAPSIESVKRWKYNPKIIDGRAIGRTGVENTVPFRVLDAEGKFIPE